VHGNGYYLTKHAIGVYSSEAPTDAPEPAELPTESPAPAVELDADASGAATITAWTVPYGRDGEAEAGIVIADVAEGRRTIARADADLTSTMLASGRDLVGEKITVHSGVASSN
jgi:acetyl-CoA C-acetyltransferase